MEEFEEKLKKCEKRMAAPVFEWTKTNKLMLFKSATTFAKLRAGFLLQYSTTNSSENFNKYVKGFLSKPLPADRLLDKVVKICQGLSIDHRL